jgi:hypothetical protein
METMLKMELQKEFIPLIATVDEMRDARFVRFCRDSYATR